MFGYATHFVLASVEGLLIALLLFRGLRALVVGFRRRARSAGTAPHNPLTTRRGMGFLWVAPALGLLLPVAAGAPMAISLVSALVVSFLLMLQFGQQRRRRAGLVAALGSLFLLLLAVATLAFTLLEGRDPLATGRALARKAYRYQQLEAEWHAVAEENAPSVGDPAPDFELMRPDGREGVRLSDFEGQRPVLLLFGAHT